MNWEEWIEQTPETLGGKARIRGRRISVESILEKLGEGWTTEDLIRSFNLEPEHIRAAQAYAGGVPGPWISERSPFLPH
ncbi:DUF433 domain-containing protein [bacterium]|nr:DUF433 domain-containing protein [bacterium]